MKYLLFKFDIGSSRASRPFRVSSLLAMLCSTFQDRSVIIFCLDTKNETKKIKAVTPKPKTMDENLHSKNSSFIFIFRLNYMRNYVYHFQKSPSICRTKFCTVPSPMIEIFQSFFACSKIAQSSMIS